MEPAVLRRELSAIALTLLAVFLTGAVVFNAPDAGQSCLEATGVFGPAGTWARCALVSTVGIPGAAIVALGCLVVALTLFGRLARADDASDWGVLFTGTVTLVPVAIGLALGGEPSASDSSGLWGSFAAHYLRKGLGPAGAWVFFLLATSALTVATLRWNPIRILLGSGARNTDPDSLAGGQSAERAVVSSRKRPTLAQQLEPEPEDLPAIDPVLARDVLASAKPDARFAPPETGRDAAKTKKIAREADRPVAPVVEAALDLSSEPSPFSDDLPPTDLLTAAPARNADAGKRELDLAGEKLMATLRTFKVDGELVGRTTGPTVTQFEIEPAPGVKVRQIAALADDLALAMRAPSIRIVAPIPGRGAVGVEVPNPTPDMVVLREVLESAEFRQMRAALPIALGKDLEGRAVIADLAKMPHLLIAGATGSGKSVCVNTIITSLVYRHTPRTLRFLMVDPNNSVIK